MKKLLTLVRLEEENRKIEALKKSSWVTALSTLYPYKKSSSNSITVAIKRPDKP